MRQALKSSHTALDSCFGHKMKKSQPLRHKITKHIFSKPVSKISLNFLLSLSLFLSYPYLLSLRWLPKPKLVACSFTSCSHHFCNGLGSLCFLPLQMRLNEWVSECLSLFLILFLGHYFFMESNIKQIPNADSTTNSSSEVKKNAVKWF